ncbi:hypothetical protein [Mangrovicoccus sp. HB161399]|uniref:hypothetical protein n=1 Tax=Mangrovicoccus sp. HB161399 TaxID=2720392 RepID=UPI0015541C4E|nr:hypothetical protein [Mangrovicoccus sp. HB161399]
MRLVIHAGMHKTGSSSIQETFYKLNRPEVKYAPFERKNHGSIFEALTSENPSDHFAFRQIGLGANDVESYCYEKRRQFDDFLGSNASIGIFSAEHLSAPLKFGQLEKFKKIIEARGVDLDVIIYVRPPHSFMESAFQQRVKGSNFNRFDLRNLWPKYRKRVEALDVAFGRGRVTVRAFEPWNFPSGCIVRDFSEFVGVSLRDDEVRRENDGISAEATALLYIQRKFGTGMEPPWRGMPMRNIKWAEVLGKIGTGKLRFSDELICPIISENIDDLNWIEDRLGKKLVDKRSDDGVKVTSEGDLVSLGVQQVVHVENLLRQKLDYLEEDPRKKIVKLLESLRALC